MYLISVFTIDNHCFNKTRIVAISYMWSVQFSAFENKRIIRDATTNELQT